jgi:hypothetical protein
MRTPRLSERRLEASAKVLLIVALLVMSFLGNRCEKQRKAGPTTPPKEPAVAADAASEHEAGEDAEVPDAAAGDDAPSETAAEVADASGDAADAPDAEAPPAITFKNVPKIPSFKPSPNQPVADPKELEYLTDQDKTLKILSEGSWAKRKGQLTLIPMKRERVADGLAWRFRILLALSDDDEPITGFFKPRQENYWDWLKEVHAYNIGRRINAPTIPTVLRFFKKTSFSGWLGKTPAEETTMFKWEGKKDPKIRGALKYWVPSYWHRHFGAKVANEDYMTAIAKSIHPANREKLEKEYPLYLEVGRGIIFDYLIINEDRPENLGTILMPDGMQKLVLIDNGLALGVEHAGRTVMKKMFLGMRMFPKDMIDAIRTLDKDELTDMLRPPDDPVMWLPEVCVDQIVKRKDFILKTVDEWHAKWGDIVWY